MPMMPARRCHGCGQLVTAPRCPTCVQAADRRRGSAAQRGYCSARWRTLRAQKLDQDPLCSVCARQGFTVRATEVDHLQRHRGPDDPLFWAWANLDSKCKPCHSRKTATETWDVDITTPAGAPNHSGRRFSQVQNEEPVLG